MPATTLAAAPPATPAPLWPIPLPIICVCGEVGSGKTLFGLTIGDPATTLSIDEEGSAASYQPSLGFTRLSLTHEVARRHRGGFQPIHAYEWFRDFLLTVPKGKYRVGALDTMAMIDAGITDWVEANPTHFNHSAKQYEAMSGIKWGDVDEAWKVIISECEARFETFVFVSHMKEVFADKKPTGRRKPGWKKAFDQRASLILQIERKADAKGVRPDKPSAIVLKDRLSVPTFDPATGEFKVSGILPPRLPVATPKAIREYMAKPVDYAKLKPAERIQAPDAVPEEELIAALTRAAEAQAEATRLEMEKLARLEAADARRASAKSGATATATAATANEPPAPEPAPSGGQPVTNGAQQASGGEGEQTARKPVTEDQLIKIGQARTHYYLSQKAETDEQQRDCWRLLLSNYGVTSAKQLTADQAESLLKHMVPF